MRSFAVDNPLSHNKTEIGVTVFICLWLCAGLLWVLPNHGGSGLALPQNLLAWSTLSLITLWCILTGKNGRCIYPRGTTLIVIGAVLWSLPIIWSPVTAWQWNALPKVLALWGLVFVCLLLLKSTSCHRLEKKWLLILVVATLLQVVYGMVQLSDMQHLPGGRPYGSFQQINVMASFLATGIVSAQWLFTVSRKPLATSLSAITLVIVSAMLVLIQSRTGYLGAITGSVILLIASHKKRRKRASLALMMLITGVIIGLGLLRFGPLMFPGMIPDFVEKEGSTLERWNILRLTWTLIMQHPVVGNGYGSFEVLLGQHAQQMPLGLKNATIQYPHNEFLYTWMEGGIIALMGLLLMVTGILKRLWDKGGRRWAGLALLLPLALHVNLEYPLYQSVTHSVMLLMLIVITGPAAKRSPTVVRAEKPLRIGAGILASVVLAFMLSGVITEVQMTRIEQQGLAPLVIDENTAVAALVNPLSQSGRLDFDRHVALLIKFNLTQNVALLTQYQTWAETLLKVHNNPDVYNSLMMIYRALGNASSQPLCLKAKTMWPEDPRFKCND